MKNLQNLLMIDAKSGLLGVNQKSYCAFKPPHAVFVPFLAENLSLFIQSFIHTENVRNDQ